ncbi:MAG: glutamate--tRNA ligase, partial [Clostridia bacterium]|nr:glutamate--tRNA ligase [Clostridia bacterium]
SFIPCYEPLPGKIDNKTAAELLDAYLEVYDPVDEQSEWFEKIKGICPQFGFASDMKTYKANPDEFKGNPGEVSTVIRLAVTGRVNTPDLCGIMRALGKEEVANRISKAIDYYKN